MSSSPEVTHQCHLIALHCDAVQGDRAGLDANPQVEELARCFGRSHVHIYQVRIPEGDRVGNLLLLSCQLNNFKIRFLKYFFLETEFIEMEMQVGLHDCLQNRPGQRSSGLYVPSAVEHRNSQRHLSCKRLTTGDSFSSVTERFDACG